MVCIFASRVDPESDMLCAAWRHPVQPYPARGLQLATYDPVLDAALFAPAHNLHIVINIGVARLVNVDTCSE